MVFAHPKYQQPQNPETSQMEAIARERERQMREQNESQLEELSQRLMQEKENESHLGEASAAHQSGYEPIVPAQS